MPLCIGDNMRGESGCRAGPLPVHYCNWRGCSDKPSGRNHYRNHSNVGAARRAYSSWHPLGHSLDCSSLFARGTAHFGDIYICFNAFFGDDDLLDYSVTDDREVTPIHRYLVITLFGLICSSIVVLELRMRRYNEPRRRRLIMRLLYSTPFMLACKIRHPVNKLSTMIITSINYTRGLRTGTCITAAIYLLYFYILWNRFR